MSDNDIIATHRVHDAPGGAEEGLDCRSLQWRLSIP